MFPRIRVFFKFKTLLILNSFRLWVPRLPIKNRLTILVHLWTIISINSPEHSYILVSLSLRHSKQSPTSGPLHVLFCLYRAPPQITVWVIPAYLSGICSKITSSEGSSLINLYKRIYSFTLCCTYLLYFLHSVHLYFLHFLSTPPTRIVVLNLGCSL